MNDFDLLVYAAPTTDAPPQPATADAPADPEPAPRAVDPARAAAGRLGGRRAHELVLLGREYEREHGLKAGRQRLKQLIQLGQRYEVEHGLRPAPRRRETRGDAWQEFVAALARVVRPAHRPAVEQLAAALRPEPAGAAAREPRP